MKSTTRLFRFLRRFNFGIIILLTGWLNLNAADFYVSNDGDDTWDGTAAEYKGGTTGPWLTLDKVNQQMELLEGETVLFRCGDRFEGTLEISGENISFGSYGEGGKPVISGALSLKGGWTAVAGRPNLYENLLDADVSDVAFLQHESISLPLGRTPNGDILTNDAFYDFNSRTMTSVTDPELTDAEDMAGAEIVLRKNVWTYYAYPITEVKGTTINFVSRQRATRKKGDENLQEAGYFFQKHINTLDTEGEWYYDTDSNKLYLFTEMKPNTEVYQYSIYPVVVNTTNAKEISLQGLRLELAASMGVKLTDSENIRIQDCEIALCGQEGIRLEQSSAHIEKNLITDCLAVGIHAIGRGRVVVTRNKVTNIGLIAGRGWTSGSFAPRRNGILLKGGNSEVTYNKLSSIGYLCIQHLNGNNLVYRNIIDRYNLVAFDGGAIYTYSNQRGSIVEENIIMNGMPNYVGLGSTISDMEVPFSSGIQCDAKTEELIIRNNTIFFPSTNTGPDRAIHLNFNTKDNLIEGNTMLTRGAGISTLDRDPYDRGPGEQSPPSMSGNRFEKNVIVRTNPSNERANYGAMAAFSLKETEQCDVENQGVFIDNVCAVPFKEAKVINEYQINCNEGRTPCDIWYATAEEWNKLRSYASGNLDSPIYYSESSLTEESIQLHYNDSDKSKTVQLSPGDYLDPWGNPVSGSVTISPWSSIILFKK